MFTTPDNIQAMATIVELLGGMRIRSDAMEPADKDSVTRTAMNSIVEQLRVDDAQATTKVSTGATLVLYSTPKNIVLEGQVLQLPKGITHSTEPNQELSGHRPPPEVGEVSRSMSQDIQSPQDTLSTVQSAGGNTMSQLDEPPMQMDEPLADTTQTSYSLLSSFQSHVYNDYLTSFDTFNQAYSRYADVFASNSDFLDSYKTALEATEIDAEELETHLNRYSPDAKWEDLPSSVREYHIQQSYLGQLGDLCDKMVGVSVSQEPNQDWIAAGMYFVEAELADGGGIAEGDQASITHDVRAEIEHALARDQAMYLDARDGLLGSAVSTWEQDLESQLRQFGPGQEDLFQTLNSLNAPHEPFFDAIFTNSPLNTSPPFTTLAT